MVLVSRAPSVGVYRLHTTRHMQQEAMHDFVFRDSETLSQFIVQISEVQMDRSELDTRSICISNGVGTMYFIIQFICPRRHGVRASV